jgi:hypothetical protein
VKEFDPCGWNPFNSFHRDNDAIDFHHVSNLLCCLLAIKGPPLHQLGLLGGNQILMVCNRPLIRDSRSCTVVAFNIFQPPGRDGGLEQVKEGAPGVKPWRGVSWPLLWDSGEVEEIPQPPLSVVKRDRVSRRWPHLPPLTRLGCYPFPQKMRL